jgi:hypothetical protein
MKEFLYIMAIIFVVVFVSVLLINIKHFFFKGKPLEKTCASAAADGVCACEAEGRASRSCESELP